MLLKEVKCVTCEERLREQNLFSLQKRELIRNRITIPLLKGDLKRNTSPDSSERHTVELQEATDTSCSNGNPDGIQGENLSPQEW